MNFRLSRYPAIFLVLVTFVLISIFSSSRNIEIKVATFSSIQEKEHLNVTEVYYTIPPPPDVEEEIYDENEEEVFYNDVWPPMQKALCGEGAPNLLLSAYLFQLARAEVFAEGDPRIVSKGTNSSSDPPITQMKFFAGEFGASIFKGVNEKGESFATVYVKIWKCGNNQIRWMEKKLYKHLNGTYDMLQLSNALQVESTPPPCIYTAVRDPISHFLSGYNEVEVRQLGEYNNQSAVDWPSHSKPAPYHLSVPYSSESHELRQERFRKFVQDVLLEEPTFGQHYVYSHFFPMSRILVVLKKYDKELTAYIPQLENITSTWPTFLSSTCENFPAPEVIPTMRMQGQHRSSHDQLGLYRAAKEVWKEAGPISRSLCLLHAFDYACFADLPEKIPALCREVYQEHAEEIIEFARKHYFLYQKNASNLTETSTTNETLPENR